ncbi:MAG: acyltransferase domain-containing protein [Gammaproteobacteria bacterium]|nr:MAG: acyltransferase domain-containing protein [Gammaproteobacteria bacterium]
MKPIVFMVSGQGSQYYQMGLDFYSENEFFYKSIHSLNDVAKEKFGTSVIDIMYDHKKHMSEAFEDPVISSLGIYLIEYALASTLIHCGIKPAKIIGSSMGMFVSSVLAQCLDKYQGLEAIYHLMTLIKERGEHGCMIMVLADPSLYHGSEILRDNAVLAAMDKAFGFVLSMHLTNLDCVENYLDKIEVSFHRLPVSRAYHSHWMDIIKDEFLNMNLHFSSTEPSTSLICCAKTDELKTVGTLDLWNAVRSPLLFSDTIAKIEEKMASCYIDIGPSGMMATGLKYILPQHSQSEIYTILSPHKQASKNFERIKALIRN